MKSSIHPQWFPEATVSCVCGNTFTVGSTKELIKVDICSKCHPFFTGQMRFTSQVGKIERFQKRMEEGKSYADIRIAKKAKKEKRADTTDNGPKSLKEMLAGL